MSIEYNLATIQKDIEEACHLVGRNPEDITIIGVTKYVTIERTEQLIQTGIQHIGENRTDEMLKKYEALKSSNVKWHFIGTLQSRKVRDIIDFVDVIHSVDRLSVVRQISNRANRTIDCFVQVNVSGEESKHGLLKEETIEFIESLYDYKNIRIIGLMTMAPYTKDESVIRKVFQELRALRDKIRAKNLPYAPCNDLSMGMSNDYKIAIEEGATHIRIGTKLVGESK